MSFAYRTALTGLLEGRFNLRESATESGSATASSVRAILVMSNTTADTDGGQVFVGDVATLDEFNGANYARVDLANQVVADLTTFARFLADAWSLAGLGAGTRNAVAVVLYEHITNDADSRLIAYLTIPPFNGTGINVPFQPDATQGLVLVRNAA